MPAESDAAPPTPPPFSPFQPLDASYLQHAPTPLSPYSRVIRKVKEEPVVFAFLGLTVGALVGGLSAMGRADARQSQLWMRARVFFQFCTVSALVGSIYVQAVSACGGDGRRGGEQEGKQLRWVSRALPSRC